MDFEKVLPLIISEFSREKVRYGLMGGFSMGAMGIMRSTMDLDFLLKFLTLTNAFANHKRKKFHKIKSGIFRI